MKKRLQRLIAIAAGVAALSLLSPSAAVTNAQKPLLHSKMFVLSEDANEVIRDKALHNGTVMQSFAFDNVNGRIYVVQLMAGGQQLPGEEAPVSGANRDKTGDLALTELDMSGNELGYMFLKGFGHGVQIGVQPSGDSAYLWTETDAVTEGSSGWGTRIARFSFENGKVLTPGSPELEKFQLIDGADRTTVNIDPARELLTMRYRIDGAFRYGVYRLADVLQHDYTPVADVPQPTVGTFQGFASYGRYLYLLEGTAYGTTGSVAPVGNTYITAVDLKTGDVADKQLIAAGDTLTFREPEGMAIRLPDVQHPRKAELAFGFASDFTPTRLANIYSLDRLQPAPAIQDKDQLETDHD
ncbi:Tat pathway signal sequence domain protein [Paenibacillus thalictri]|uniref:Tat pathway signal sequence domain protein n=1 Tax=Paenibacillus thalictri TaxID=2527873 RepID=A0A4Q9DL81_9BACL|nr:Tat pathway signal sequence domain protein [Paenibacillus thalictri]TBL75759.1 Tat pathway signal sequence domain protein [Paenibacillus thalictri]